MTGVPPDIDAIKADIQLARSWAKAHFNTDGPDGFFDPPTSDLEFPEPDTMHVYPRFMGKRMGMRIQYRLKWQHGGVGWEGYHPLSLGAICWLRVK